MIRISFIFILLSNFIFPIEASDFSFFTKGITLAPRSSLKQLDLSRHPEKLVESLGGSQNKQKRLGQQILQRSLFPLALRVLLVLSPCFGGILACSGASSSTQSPNNIAGNMGVTFDAAPGAGGNLGFQSLGTGGIQTDAQGPDSLTAGSGGNSGTNTPTPDGGAINSTTGTDGNSQIDPLSPDSGSQLGQGGAGGNGTIPGTGGTIQTDSGTISNSGGSLNTGGATGTGGVKTTVQSDSGISSNTGGNLNAGGTVNAGGTLSNTGGAAGQINSGAGGAGGSTVIDPVAKAEDALLKGPNNSLGLPITFKAINGTSPSYPDRAYAFDMGSELLFGAQNKTQWGPVCNAYASKLVSLQNPDGTWANAYGNSGISDSTKNLGPTMVVARGLLAWADGTLADPKYLAAKKAADLWIDTPLKQITVNGFYALRQNPDKADDVAATEENGRAALTFIDLYRYLEIADHTTAMKYRKAAESILKAFISLKGEVYPLGGILNSGAADWNLPARQGGDGQSLMLQAVGYYLSVFPSDPDSVIQADWAKRQSVMDWIIKTFGNSKNTLTSPDGKATLSIPQSLAKRIDANGVGENQIWVEFTAEVAMLMKAFFIKDYPGKYDTLYAGYISTLKNLQLSDGTWPYAPFMSNGYSLSSNWDNLSTPLNWPFSSSQATLAATSALKEGFPLTYLANKSVPRKGILLALNGFDNAPDSRFLGMNPIEAVIFNSSRPGRYGRGVDWAS